MGGTNLTNQELCAGFGIFAEATGLVPAKYENMKASEIATWNITHIPEVKKFVSTLNIQVAPHFEGIYFDHDLSGTPPFVEKRKANAEEGKKYFDMGISTRAINERLGLGFAEDDCPDEGMLPVTLLPVGTTRVEDEERSVRVIDGVSNLHYRAVDRRRLGWERSVTEKVRVLFAAESSAVTKAVKSGKVDTDPAIESQRGAWVKTLTAVYRAVIEDFGEDVYDELVPRAIDDVETRDFDPWAKEIQKYVMRQVAEEIAYIQTTTKKAIRKIVLTGFKEGQSVLTVARSIRETYDGWEAGEGVYRSMRIARTEIHNAAGYAMHESAKQSGVAKKKHWMDAGDERVRDSHAANTAAGWIGFDEPYPNGAIYPGDGTDDVLCRCVEGYQMR